MTYRNWALLGGFVGLALGGALTALTRRRWPVVLGTLGGMVLAPMLAGASGKELGTALFLPVRRANRRRRLR